MCIRDSAWGCNDCKDQCVDEQGYPNCEIHQLKERVMEAMNAVPTAYDVDEVIGKLEAKKNHRFYEAAGRRNYKTLAQGYIQASQDAIDIVKRGVIDG